TPLLPPRSTLPPFPTRRSSDLGRGRVHSARGRDDPAQACVGGGVRSGAGARIGRDVGDLAEEIDRLLHVAHEVAPGHLLVLQHLDRKSTRLNSSHRTISYAVFC